MLCVYVTVNVDRGHGLKGGHEKRKEALRVVMRRIIGDEEPESGRIVLREEWCKLEWGDSGAERAGGGATETHYIGKY